MLQDTRFESTWEQCYRFRDAVWAHAPTEIIERCSAHSNAWTFSRSGCCHRVSSHSIVQCGWCSSWLHCNENVFFNTLNSVTALRFRGMSLVLSLNIGSPAQMEGLITCYQRNLAGRQRFFHKCHISACVGFVCLALMRNSVVMLNVSLKMRMYEWCRAILVRSLFG